MATLDPKKKEQEKKRNPKEKTYDARHNPMEGEIETKAFCQQRKSKREAQTRTLAIQAQISPIIGKNN